ncbi:MAG: hypothetical protein WCR06_00170 [bacterium]
MKHFGFWTHTPRAFARFFPGVTVLAMFAFATPAMAQQKPPAAPGVPEVSRIDDALLNRAVRASLACATSNLLARSTKNYQNLVVEPWRRTSQRFVRYGAAKTNELHFSNRPFEEPVYLHPVYADTYENYEAFETEAGASSTDRRQLKKVIRKRQIRTIVSSNKVPIIVGSKTVMRLVGDPTGTVVQIRVDGINPIYATVEDPDYWTTGFLMQNAMALATLRKCGVAESDPALASLIQRLSMFVSNYGIPDTTLDVAWLAAAFAQVHDEGYNDIRRQLISKLLDGQIADEGPACGMWGPVCVNGNLLAAMITYEQTLSADVAKKKELAGYGSTTNANLAQDLAFSQAVLADFADEYLPFTQQGLRFDTFWNDLRNPGLPQTGAPPVDYQGLPFCIYKETFADMECTAVALFAIRLIMENGFLPEATLRPEINKPSFLRRPAGGPKPKRRHLLPPEKTETILARAAAAIAARQKPDGTWDEGIVQQPVRAFDQLPGLGGFDTNNLRQWVSTQTLYTAAQGYAGLANAGMSAGLSKFLEPYFGNLQNGQQVQRKAAEDFLNGMTPPIGTRMGGILEPYSYIYALRGIHRVDGSAVQDRRDLWQRFAWRLLELQNKSGTWGGGNVLVYPPCLLARREPELKAYFERQQANQPVEQRKPYDFLEAQRRWNWQNYEWANGEIIATCQAMLFLLDGIRPPVAGYVADVSTNASARRMVLDAADALGKQKNLALDCLWVHADSPASAQNLPLLYAVDDTLRTPQGKALAQNYLQTATQGVLVVATQQAPAMEGVLLPFVDGGSGADLPVDQGFLKGFAEPNPPKLRGIMRKDRQPAVIFLPVSTAEKPPDGQLSLQTAVRVVSLLMQDRLPPEVTDPRYPIALGNAIDPFLIRIQTLELLQRLAKKETQPAASP